MIHAQRAAHRHTIEHLQRDVYGSLVAKQDQVDKRADEAISHSAGTSGYGSGGTIVIVVDVAGAVAVAVAIFNDFTQ